MRPAFTGGFVQRLNQASTPCAAAPDVSRQLATLAPRRASGSASEHGWRPPLPWRPTVGLNLPILPGYRGTLRDKGQPLEGDLEETSLTAKSR